MHVVYLNRLAAKTLITARQQAHNIERRIRYTVHFRCDCELLDGEVDVEVHVSGDCATDRISRTDYAHAHPAPTGKGTAEPDSFHFSISPPTHACRSTILPLGSGA